ncbi:MAG TPA: hypothetical protein VJ969_12370 [Desulfopila sp.]|nr:hypothetical protein [Desulfopila sp.]
MEELLDSLWEVIAAAMQLAASSAYAVLEHLHFMGPATVIGLLALLSVVTTKLLSRLIISKRYLVLEEEYHHWYQLRQEALKCEDAEKGRMMARNIDSAHLNKAYYDYFFEGLLLGIARRILPIFFIFAFINEFYRPERMLEVFGRQHVVLLDATGGEPLAVGAVFWYFFCLVCGYILWALAAKFISHLQIKNAAAPRLTATATEGSRL